MVALAELRVRTDRKYIIDHDMLDRLLEDQAEHVAILDIDGRRLFNYETVYFDTANLDLYRAAATGRRRRFKVRTRVYLDSDVAVVEVKLKDGRGRTVKPGLDYSPDNRRRLTAEAKEFVDDLTGQPGLAATLSPVLTTNYRRMTIVDRAAQSRATIDRGLVCTNSDGDTVGMDSVISSRSRTSRRARSTGGSGRTVVGRCGSVSVVLQWPRCSLNCHPTNGTERSNVTFGSRLTRSASSNCQRFSQTIPSPSRSSYQVYSGSIPNR